MQNEDQRLKSLDICTVLEIQASEKRVVKRCKTIEETMESDEQEKKVQRQNLTLLVPVRDYLPRNLASYPLINSKKSIKF